METKGLGLYVHIPFCVRKCNYCDFASEAAGESKIDKYVARLISEIESYRSNEKIKINTVFFGGGTPSLLSGERFLKIVSTIKESFEILPDAEFTVEVNPATLSDEKILAYKEAGVNRISIGVQSIHEIELKKLGRIHNVADFENTYKALRDAGFKNISVDLMYGIPYQTKDSFEKTLDKIIMLSPEHVSCYGLIVEEGTPFFEERKSLPLPDEDEEYEMYATAHEKLALAGYSHYEISNYAKDGFECRHNLKYWRDEEYIGVGLAAYSYYRGKRYGNSSSFDEYFASDSANYNCKEKEQLKDPFEYAMLALRLKEGFSLSEYERIFGKRFAEGKEKELDLFSKKGLIEIREDRIFLTYKGFYVSNSILSELL